MTLSGRPGQVFGTIDLRFRHHFGVQDMDNSVEKRRPLCPDVYNYAYIAMHPDETDRFLRLLISIRGTADLHSGRSGQDFWRSVESDFGRRSPR